MTIASFFWSAINLFIEALGVLILIRVVFSWLSPHPTALSRWIQGATDPILEPIQKLLPRGPLDFSPLIALLLLGAIREILFTLN